MDKERVNLKEYNLKAALYNVLTSYLNDGSKLARIRNLAIDPAVSYKNFYEEVKKITPWATTAARLASRAAKKGR